MRNSADCREKEQFWRWVLEEQRRSGLTAKAFCQQQGVSLPSFYAWRRKIRERDALANRVADPQQSLVPVTVVDSGDNDVSQLRSAKSIEIITPSGFTLRVDQAAATEIAELLRTIISCQPEATSC